MSFFAISYWIIWRRRNELVHQNVLSPVHAVLIEIKGINHYMSCMNSTTGRLVCDGQSRESSIAIQSDTVRIFVDGVFSNISHVAGCRMVIRNEAFSRRLQESAVINAEVWGCICGLRRAWDLRLNEINLFCDSTKFLSLVDSAE